MDSARIARAALENAELVSFLKRHFAPDGAAGREHNAADGSLGFGAIHYGLVVNLRPRRALVIGSRHGYIPATVALALKFNGGGTLDFVDANYSDATDVRCQINLDLSPNEASRQDELRASSMNAPLWRRHVYVLDRVR